MSARPIEIGAVGLRVASNITKLRKARDMSMADLAAECSRWGRPYSTSMIGKIEKTDRRVDVDDLAVIAGCLGVKPSALLGTVKVDVTWDEHL